MHGMQRDEGTSPKAEEQFKLDTPQSNLYPNSGVVWSHANDAPPSLNVPAPARRSYGTSGAH